MKIRDIPFSREYLLQRLRYDPETGSLVWLKAKSQWRGREAGTINKVTGYRSISLGCKTWPAHRIIWKMAYGTEPPHEEIDHINGDRTDNRLANLRSVTSTENARNCKRSSGNTSGILGVHWYRRTQKWHAQIKVNYRNISLGYFASLDEASAARKAAERAYGFHPNHGRAA